MKKRQEAKDLNKRVEYLVFLNESCLTENQINTYITLSRDTLKEINILIDQKLKTTIKFKTLAKIVVILKRFKMALDIKTASKLVSLIPTYDGNPGGVKSFIDAITLVESIVPENQQNAAIQLILTKQGERLIYSYSS